MSSKDTTPAVEAPEVVDTPAPAAPVADPVVARLVELGLLEGDAIALKNNLGLSEVSDIRLVTEEDLKEVGLTKITQRKFLEAIAPAPVVPEPAAPIVSNATFDAVLPSVPMDESWLTALKTGGILKVDQSTVIGAVRAALAKKVGLYDVPAILVAAMENYADESEEQVDPIFFQLREQMIRRSYAEIFSAIPGLNGSFVTKERKNQLLSRLDHELWPAIVSFNNQLKGWQESWMQGVTNPGVIMMAMMGGGSGVLPPGVMQTPETSALRDAADAVKDAINRVFAGTGIQISAALAFEASEIRKSLEDSRLPALVGVANREQLLKKLRVAVPATYPRLEVNVVKYVLGVLGLEDQAAGNEELSYLSALFMLGSQIDWSQLGTGRVGRDNDFSRIGEVALRGMRS